MRAINKKLLRDMWHMKAQMLAIIVVMSCGVGTFVMSSSIHESLVRIRQRYYVDYDFADIFVTLKRAPESLAERVAEIEGVARWDARIVTAVRLEFAGQVEPAVGQLISLPEQGTDGLNRIFLRSGRLPEPGTGSEVAISESFANAHQMQLGSSIEAVINGRRQLLSVAGIALSPEYIYEIPPGGLLPDNKTFGVLWMDRRALAAAVDMTGAFNNVALKLSSPQNAASVIRQLDQLTERYGGLGAISRDDHQSHKFIENELNELRTMSVVAPSIFLSVAAFLLNIVLSRVIGTQREQIAALKAFGYSNRQVAWHYLKMALTAAVIGSICGTALGVYLGQGMTRMYTKFFNFPTFEFHLPLKVVAIAWLVGGVCAAVAVWASIRHAMLLPPAEAMRPEPPATYHQTWLESVGGWFSRSAAAKMVFRQIGRTPRRSLLSILGVSMAIAVLVLGSFMADAVDFLFDAMFRLSQRYDVDVALVETTSATAVTEISQMPGVLACEGYRTVPARIRFGHRHRLTAVQGYATGLDLVKLINQDRQSTEIPTSGLMISAELARIFCARIGDVLTVEVLEGKRPVFEIQLTKTVDDFAGTSAYLQHAELCRLMNEELAVSGAMLAIDPDAEQEVLRRLNQMPTVAKVNVSRATRDSFQRTLAENINRMRLVNLMFSFAISIGVVYSTARISFAERNREMATMRVLGFSQGEVTSLLIAELSILTIAAIPIGSGLGYCLAWAMISASDAELFRLPLVIQFDTYVFASAVVLAATVFACTLLRYQVNRLDLVEVLKSRE
jgi:putative ABC transport system permease protein